MNMLFVSSSYFLRNIPVAILNKREIIKLKMQRYKDVKVYLYSFILPDYMTDKYVSEQLDALASHLLFPHLILSIANTTIYNPRLVANNVNGIVHIVLCFEHDWINNFMNFQLWTPNKNLALKNYVGLH